MPSALSVIRNHGPGMLVEAGVEGGVGFGLGWVYHMHGNKWWGKGAPRIAAILGKIGSLLARMGSGKLAGVVSGGLNAVGSAGVAALGLEYGLRVARSRTGKRAVLMAKGAALPAGGEEITSIGALPPAQPGRALSWDAIEELATMH